MDRFEAMETLLAVISAGSLSSAARNLQKPLPTVSRRLSELEAHLGTRLLDRSARRVTLTEAGASYAEAARAIIAEVHAAERAAAAEFQMPKGELTITAPNMLGRLHLLPIVAAFLSAYPDINITLRLTPRIVNLQEEHVDCAIRIGVLPDSSMVAMRLALVRRVIGASPAYLARRGRPQTIDDLATHDLITYAPMSRAESWQFPGRDIEIRSRLVVDELNTVADAALNGAGIARLFSYHVADHVRHGRLELILQEYEPPRVPVSIVHLPGAQQAQKLRAFLEFAAPRLKERLQNW